jgi:hypothetical protein
VNPDYPQLTPRPLPAVPSVVASRPRSWVYVGFLLALVGIGAGVIGLIVTFAGSSWFTPTLDGLILRMGIESAAFASASVLGGIGLFLVFFSIARVQPATRPWTVLAALVLLATGTAGAGLQFASFLVYPAIFSRPSSDDAIRLLITIGTIRSAVGVAGSIAMLLGLFGVTKPIISSL